MGMLIGRYWLSIQPTDMVESCEGSNERSRSLGYLERLSASKWDRCAQIFEKKVQEPR